MRTTVSASDARTQLPALLDQVEQGDEITITRHGRPVAVLMSVDAARRQRTARAYAGVERLRARMAENAARPLDDLPTISVERAEQLVAELDADRGPRW